MKRHVFSILLLALAGMIYAALPDKVRDRVSGVFSLEYPVPVVVTTARLVTPEEPVKGRGRLEAASEIRVAAPAAGVLKEMNAPIGARVAAGAVIATLESGDAAERVRDQEQSREETEGEIERSRRQLVQAEARLATLRDWFAKRLVARREVDDAETAVRGAEAQLEAQEARLKQGAALSAHARQVLGLSRIVAPLAGIVTRHWAMPGATVVEKWPLVTIAQIGSMRLWIDLKSADAAKLKAGTPARVSPDALAGRVFPGRVRQIQELANFYGDESSVEVEVPNPGGVLQLDMEASVALITGDRHEGLFVARRALSESRERKTLYVAARNRARLREVKTGREAGDRVEIVEGLAPGDLVVVSGLEHLRDGRRVRTVEQR